jgi:hypothetical protein
MVWPVCQCVVVRTVTAYLRFVLERIADHPIKKLQELLPWNFVGATVEAERSAA